MPPLARLSHFLLRCERARICTDFALAQQPEYSSVIQQSNLVHCIYETLLQPLNTRLSHFLLRCERARICTDFALARSPEYSNVIHQSGLVYCAYETLL
jgi:hypothetical protein